MNTTALQPPGRPWRSRPGLGFTLVELMIVLLIMGVLIGIGVPSYQRYMNQAKNSQIKNDFLFIEAALDLYRRQNGQFPASLDDLDIKVPNDPWGNLYQYTRVDDEPGTEGQLRKDHNLHPVNDDFDLYSMGADGKSATPFTAKISQDDYVRANNGEYMGLVSDY